MRDLLRHRNGDRIFWTLVALLVFEVGSAAAQAPAGRVDGDAAAPLGRAG